MITLDSYKFHDQDGSDRTWTETMFIIFSVPEACISGSLYVLTRPNLGVCHSAIEIHQGMCFHPWQIDHCDAQMHLPCPEDFSDFTLENGLTFKAHSAEKLEYRYASLDGYCDLTLGFNAICRPIDTHDPEDNPLAGQSKVSGYDGWNNGHMEGKGRTHGTLRLGDKHYTIDCIDGINKSWGPRNDWGNKAATWVHVDLGEDLNAFLIFGITFENKEMTYGPFKYGYISEHGERRPIMNAEMRAQRHEMLVTRAAVEFEDGHGNRYQANGTTVAGAPWYNFNPASAGFQTLMHWRSGDRSGYSHIADFTGLGFLSRGMAETVID